MNKVMSVKVLLRESRAYIHYAVIDEHFLKIKCWCHQKYGHFSFFGYGRLSKWELFYIYNIYQVFNINEGLVLLKLADMVLIFINTGPSNVNLMTTTVEL